MSAAKLSVTPHAGVPDVYTVEIDCEHATTTALVADPHQELTQREAVRLAVARHGRCRCGRRLARRLGCS